MTESTTRQPSELTKKGLACLLAGIDTGIFDNGVPEPWGSIGNRLRAADINDRRRVFRAAIDELGHSEFGHLISELAAIDPTDDEKPTGESGHGLSLLPPALPFPVDALPRPLCAYVQEGAAAIGCPPDYIAVPLLASASAAIGTTVRIQIKSEWYEWASLYTAVVAPSGAKKTPALKYALRFASEKSIEFDLEHQRNLDSHEHALAEYRAAAEARKRAKDKSELPEPPDKPQRPTMKRATIGDVTVEALGKRLKENPRGLLSVRDELASLLLSLNQYRGGRGSDLQTYLSLWSSCETTIDRKKDEDPIVLHQPFLSIAGGIQPGILPKILGRDRLLDGCTPRFLFGDPQPLPHRPSEASVQEGTIDRARKVFETLWRICQEEPYSTPPKPHLVRLSRQAREQFVRFETSVGNRLNELSPDDPFAGPLAKLPGYLGRLVLILHVIKWTERATERFDDVDEQTMSEAITLADYFVAHAGRVWRRLLESPEDTQMRQLQDWMGRRRIPVTVREIMQSGVAGFKRAAEVRAVLDRMDECGLLLRTVLGRTERYSRRVTSTSADKGISVG